MEDNKKNGTKRKLITYKVAVKPAIAAEHPREEMFKYYLWHVNESMTFIERI